MRPLGEAATTAVCVTVVRSRYIKSKDQDILENEGVDYYGMSMKEV
jgi:hypothetical protein